MKILLAYDGSSCAEAAIDDLYHAGLPPTGSIHVVTVAEVWLPPPEVTSEATGISSMYIEEVVRSLRARVDQIVEAAEANATRAADRLRRSLPAWKVTSAATSGSPAWEILDAATKENTDLIVVGSHGHSALSRFLLGSISQKVLTEARCSVRVARGKNEVDPSPERIIIGFDGTRGATAAIDSVISRRWHERSKVRLITAAGALSPQAIPTRFPHDSHFSHDVELIERRWMEHLAQNEIVRLRDSGVEASFYIYPGNPKEILVKEAERWSANCIFVGAHAHTTTLERVLLGTTSAAVAARAHCSVEVVRAAVTPTSGSNGKP